MFPVFPAVLHCQGPLHLPEDIIQRPGSYQKSGCILLYPSDQMTDDKFFCFFSHFSYCTSYVSCYSHIPNHYIICTIKKEAAFCGSFFFYICSYRLLIAVTSASIDARMISESTPAPHARVPSGLRIPTYAIALDVELRSSACS